VATPPQASEAFYKTLQGYQLLLLTAVRSLWAGMLPGNFDGSWARLGPQVVAVTAGAQLAAATAGVQYVPAVLAETNQPDEPLARIRPAAFAGVAQDGRDLGSLLEGSVRVAKRASADGATAERALELGGNWLDMVAQTLATDAARDAVQAEISIREGMRWARMVNPPCCSRCAVLAGRTYSWKADFLRHPRCDCLAIPATEANAEDYVTNPRALVERGLITDLTKAQKQRLDDGADLSRVLNESRDRWRTHLRELREFRKARDDARFRPKSPIAAGPRETFLTRMMAGLNEVDDAVKRARDLRDAGIAE